MKKFFNIFMLFWIITLSKAQNQCATQMPESTTNTQGNSFTEILVPGACNKTSPYANNASLYLPKLADSTITIRLNFIFPTKPDGTGNFEDTPAYHTVLDDVVLYTNSKLALLDGTATSSACPGVGENNLHTAKYQIKANYIWKVDPAWDYLQTGYTPNCSPLPTCTNSFSYLNPADSGYYYSYYDNDPTIPLGINIVFANNGIIYNNIVNNHNYSNGGEGWAASMNSSNSDYTQNLRQFYPNTFLNYLIKMKQLADNPDPAPWPQPYLAFLHDMAGGIMHETGHSFNLDHQNNCPLSVMNQGGDRTYMSNAEIAQTHYAASITSIRKYFTEDSFKKTNIDVTSDEVWDLNFRLYSNVKIDNESSLKATCKIIMAPQSRFIVKDGSNFIIEGAEITSANNSSWNGIKVEGNGYLLINPDTLIDTGYFYAYADNTPLPGNKINSEPNKSNKALSNENSLLSNDYKIYPNPTGDFINIETTSKISKIEVYNLLNKSFPSKYKDNKVDVRSLPQGSYILKIYTSAETKTVNFIKL